MTSKGSIIFTIALYFAVFSLALSTVSAYPEMEVNPSYSYGTDIVMTQHLIEIDQVSYDGYINIAETLVIRNAGTENYTGPIYAWIPDEAFDVNIALLEMAMSGQINLINYSMEGNVVSWDGTVLAGSNMPPMYRLEYKVPKVSTDTISVTKKLKYPTLVNYNYLPPQSMPALVIKVMKSEGMETSFTNGAGSKMEPDSVEILEDSRTYNWALPLFEEITIKSEKPGAGSADITLYLLIVLIIIVVIGYPVLRGKSTALKKDLNLDQLTSAKKSMLNLLLELDEDYSNGNLSEEEYNRIRSDYKDKTIEILRQIDTLEE